MTEYNLSTNAAISIEELTAQPLPIFGYSARAFRKVSLEGGQTFEGYGDIILRDPVAIAIQNGQTVHRKRISVLGRAAEPVRCALLVRRPGIAIAIQHTQSILCTRVLHLGRLVPPG